MSSLKTCILIWIIWCVQNRLLLITTKEQSNNSYFLSKCISNIIRRFDKINLLYGVDLDLPLNSFPTIKINSNVTSFKWFRYERNHVCVINLEDENLEVIIEKLLRFPTIDPRSYFVIIAKRKVDKSIFITASKYYIYQLVVVEVESYFQQKLYSYKPYEFENVNEPQTDFYHLATCSEGDLDNLANVLETNLPKKWRNTTINALTRRSDPYLCISCKEKGIEIDIFEIAAHRLGITSNYTGNPLHLLWGAKINGSYNRVMGALERREGDMVIGCFGMNLEENQDFDMSFAHMEDTIYWVVPKAKILPNWKRLGLIFSPRIYLCLLLSSATVMVVCKLLYGQSFASVMMVLYQILVEATVPLNKSSRIIIITWIGSALVLSSIFKTKLMGTLYEERYEHQINSLSDIIAAGLVINITSYRSVYYRHYENSDEEYVLKNHHHCENHEACVNRSAFQRDTATFSFSRTYEYRIPNYIDKYGNLLLHLTRDPVVPIHYHLFFVKGYPVFPQIDQLLLEIRSSGFVQLAYDRLEYKNNLALKRKGLSVEVLGFEKMYVAFGIWCLGLFVSLLVFLVEKLSKISQIN